jgi:four helix bundle protein
MEKKMLKDRVLEFSVSLLSLHKDLESIKQYVIATQLLRSGTAIGALVHEAEFAETREDFIHKLKIALKEANETEYWLKITASLISLDTSINENLSAMIRILNKSILTARQNRPNKKEKER